LKTEPKHSNAFQQQKTNFSLNAPELQTWSVFCSSVLLSFVLRSHHVKRQSTNMHSCAHSSHSTTFISYFQWC